jgi:hypothetical protein
MGRPDRPSRHQIEALELASTVETRPFATGLPVELSVPPHGVACITLELAA